MVKKKIGARIYPAHKPKFGTKRVLYWAIYSDEPPYGSWIETPSNSLERYDIWRYIPAGPPPPSERLIARATKLEEDEDG